MSAVTITGLIFFISFIGVAAFTRFKYYPSNVEKAKFIYGLRNREEYYKDENKKTVLDIYDKHRKNFLKLFIVLAVIGALFFFLDNFTFKISLWTMWLLVAILAIYIPYVLGNKELKTFKKTIQIKNEKKVIIDTKNTLSYGMNKGIGFILPLIIGFVCMVIAVLFDMEIIGDNLSLSKTYTYTIMIGSFYSISIIAYICSFIMDSMKNEVISEDSDVNLNYNRAKKRNYSNSLKCMLWINTLYIIVNLVLIYFDLVDDLYVLIATVVYMFFLFLGIGIYVLRDSKINSIYKKETSIEVDDDDYWIYGMFYYNPNDKRINVEKRNGFGTTVNFGTTVGKIVLFVLGLTIIGSLFAVGLLGAYEVVPIDVKIEDGKVICHQLRDDYKIDIDDIKSVELLGKFKDVKASRTNGVGMPNLLKGNFTIKGEGTVKVFLNPENAHYIKITTDKKKYFISEAEDKDTKQTFDDIKDKLNK
ncbi:DUF5808 domain-containing protein [Eubacterium sp.]|uniref:DUF5808 domain-containing protein n=1 Tax=Eubacterium sp. TaxID=142586 RepID=UPI0025D9634F|nr:DUF5808 domain-containing protein [Eubacterium sp.]MCR5628493.1 DUF5808 domain-containing protein [Eubacterium sp.]